MNEKICGYYLDIKQKAIILDDSKYLLVVAGAGSGKTLTILGKINYLVEIKKIKQNEIICISFTKAASDSLRDKIKKEFNYNIDVYTFHKLGLTILNNKYEIADVDTLNNIVDEFFKTDILKNINLLLKYLNLKSEKQYIEMLDSNKDIKNLKKLIITFIHLFKCNNYELKDFIYFLKKARTILNLNYKKEKIFLILTFNIYLKYQKHLNDYNEIDFDDMLIIASKKVKQDYHRKIKYIIIDEYQDTSLVRFNLIKNILDKTDAKLMVVGDDFQSIYRFTGCDISLFLNFKQYFKNSKILKIENTYRNSNELINVAGKFVMKNKYQIRKKLVSNKHINNPIVIRYYVDIKLEFKKLIEEIYNEYNKPILLLGRNNFDVNLILDSNFKYVDNKIIYLKNEKIDLTYMTVHKSKGLEYDNVIIINLKDDVLGFPNKIKNEKVLRFVSLKSNYLYDEERRLFYVALTRTKNKVYLLVPIKKQSIFIKEIIKYNK